VALEELIQLEALGDDWIPTNGRVGGGTKSALGVKMFLYILGYDI